VGGSVRRAEHLSGTNMADPSVDSCSVGRLGMYTMQSFTPCSPDAPGDPGSVGCPGWPLSPGECVSPGCLSRAVTGYPGDPEKGR